jgi:hypothetical protein
VQFVPNSTYVDESGGFDRERVGPFQNDEFVRENGTYYRISFEDGQLYASYGITATVATPGENDTVVALSDLPESVRNGIRQAITEGEHYAPYGEWDSLPESLRDTEYVRHENETYRMGLRRRRQPGAVDDGREGVLSPNQANSPSPDCSVSSGSMMPGESLLGSLTAEEMG